MAAVRLLRCQGYLGKGGPIARLGQRAEARCPAVNQGLQTACQQGEQPLQTPAGGWHPDTMRRAERNTSLPYPDSLLQTCRRVAKLSSRRRSHSRPAADCEVHGMVMNIGERPTMADGGGVTVEVLGSPGPGAAC